MRPGRRRNLDECRNRRSTYRPPARQRRGFETLTLNFLAGATGLEPAASCVTGSRSNQLNYARAISTSYRYRAFPFRARQFPKLPENAVTGQRPAGNSKLLCNRFLGNSVLLEHF
jgi:hypothetical protein